MSGFNEAPREYQPTPPHEYIQMGYENNVVAAETTDVPESIPAAGAENNGTPEKAPAPHAAEAKQFLDEQIESSKDIDEQNR